MKSGKDDHFNQHWLNKNKIKLLILCFLLTSSQVWTQEDVFRYPLVAQTRATFDTVCANLAQKPIVKGNFEQEKHLNRLNRSLMSSGNFIIATKKGMVWETLKPFPSTMIMGNDFIMQSRPDGRKSVLSAQGNETFTQMADVISMVFSGQSQGLLKNFDVYFSGTVSDWNMGLSPKNSVFAAFILKITMSGASAISSIRLFEPGGDTTTYTLLSHNYPEKLNDYEEAFFTIP